MPPIPVHPREAIKCFLWWKVNVLDLRNKIKSYAEVAKIYGKHKPSVMKLWRRKKKFCVSFAVKLQSAEVMAWCMVSASLQWKGHLICGWKTRAEDVSQLTTTCCVRKHGVYMKTPAMDPLEEVTPKHLLKVRDGYAASREGLDRKIYELLKRLCLPMKKLLSHFRQSSRIWWKRKDTIQANPQLW